MKLGIDLGSTTVKLVLLDDNNEIVFKCYERHMSNVFEKVAELLDNLYKEVGDIDVKLVITGSGGLSLAEKMGLPFEQEVISCSAAVEALIPETDVVIELGGEDAKITFYGMSIEQRMNGTCAGGTGAFIDQMAVLLNTDASGLNEAAKKHEIIYPIAARCGVFAKADIQPLINEGASVNDLAASIFQAVVNQTISGLACGRPIKGNIAFLGGPLSFLDELRNRFIQTLELGEDNVIFPPNSQYFVALGAALIANKHDIHRLSDILQKMKHTENTKSDSMDTLEPLFESKADYAKFQKRHAAQKVKRKDISKVSGPVFLGIDAGSTTTKAALIDSDLNLLYSFYKGNNGKPLETTMEMLRELYSLLPKTAFIANATATGYGEGLLKSAFNIDLGEIETLVHYKAAEAFLPGVEFILDIGGQDMKCMKVKDGSIYNIMLNEACSSGCGSFLETYAKSLNMDIFSFAQEAIYAKKPVNLGTRCTVFMNSKVKQAQKEGASIGDISAGLSYSVIKNALFKVIKLRDVSEAGEKIVVQGGTFLNDAVLKSLENTLGREVVRPDISGIMGAYGAAIVSKENYIEGTASSVITLEQMNGFTVTNKNARCKLCENNCLLTINKFNNGETFVTGNRCERGAGKAHKENDLPNLFEYQYKRLFSYKSLGSEYAKRGSIGIPRVLNMYENFPFWFTFFTHLGFNVVLSPKSTKELYETGMDTIASDTACYPAKLVHGHIKALVKMGVKRIFYPSINYEAIEDVGATNHYNCPVVGTYPELIACNMAEIFNENDVIFTNPFLPYDSDYALVRELCDVFGSLGITYAEIDSAVKAARNEDKLYKDDLKKEGAKALRYAAANKKKCIVLAGRPYHLDPEINHGIDKLITSNDMVVLTSESIAHLAYEKPELRVLNQWSYHARLYRSAALCTKSPDMEMIQLNSFGCGLDAVTIDQVEEIMQNSGKLYTTLKIDEGTNLGTAKIRIRSLKAAMDERAKSNITGTPTELSYEKPLFTKEMKRDYTILLPQMAPMHFNFIEVALNECGYNAVLLPQADTHAVEEGLRYVNNDSCYPAIVSLGQIISEVKSGKYDLDKLAIFLSQTGGGCRASNYIPLLRKALASMNLSHIPVVSINIAGLEKNPGFKLSAGLMKRIIMSLVYGDLLMRVVHATRPYECEAGAVDKLYEQWNEKIKENIANSNFHQFSKNLQQIVNDFDNIPITDEKKPKIGVVGEILVKYHPNANNEIVKIIEKEGGEAVVLDLIDFFLYGMYSKGFNYEHLSGTYMQMLANSAAIKFIEMFRKPMRVALRKSKRFHEPAYIEQVAKKAEQIISLGNQCGEGWLLTGEMIELMEMGVTNIACLQPFGCLPNHVTGKGVMKALRNYNKLANIVAIDYDPGASNVNQLNRIKLMMATAHKNISE